MTHLQSLTSLSVSHSLSQRGLLVLCRHHLALIRCLPCTRLRRWQNQTELAFGHYRLRPSICELPLPVVGLWTGELSSAIFFFILISLL
ncbi:hypothetical protein AHAS_Ahas04G0168000 [Arachis hypogaea]